MHEGKHLGRPAQVLAPGLPGGHHEQRGVDRLGKDHRVGDRQQRWAVDEHEIEHVAQLAEHPGQLLATQHASRVQWPLPGRQDREPVGPRHRLECLLE